MQCLWTHFSNTINLKTISVSVRSTVVVYITQMILCLNMHFVANNLNETTAVYTT